jgi:hypothetical protein
MRRPEEDPKTDVIRRSAIDCPVQADAFRQALETAAYEFPPNF